jgi:hypothetical protein
MQVDETETKTLKIEIKIIRIKIILFMNLRNLDSVHGGYYLFPLFLITQQHFSKMVEKDFCKEILTQIKYYWSTKFSQGL